VEEFAAVEESTSTPEPVPEPVTGSVAAHEDT
jgi:hypothetical protein